MPDFGFRPRHEEFYREVVERDCYRLADLDPGPNPTFVDVGASVGAFAVAVLRRWPSARVRCVEVDAENCAAIRRVAPTAEVVCAAARGERVPAFYAPYPGDDRSCYKTRAGETPDARPVLATSTLAALLYDLDRVDLLKLDIEGDEFDVLALAAREGALDNVRRIVLEWHHAVDPGLVGHDFHPHVSDLVRTLHDFHVTVWPSRFAGGLLWARHWTVER